MIRLPYPGLRPFRRDESDLFFGREGSVDAMVDKLAQTRFLAVLGASGSGKSSLVRTGLLDGLELGLSPQMGASWRIADFRPGDRPLAHLVDVLLSDAARDDPLQRELLQDFLGRGPRSLVTWCRDGNLPAGCNLLLLVDQFEEIFRYDEYAGREEAEAFVALLLESSREPDSRIYVTITMRSEFLGACSLMPGLAERINEGLYLTSRMTREQCREAIEGPAAVTGFRLEPALVNRILNDMASFAPWEDGPGASPLLRISRRADQLPLMQHVLNRMWLRAGESAANVCLMLKAYEEVGGLAGALDEHGTEIITRIGSQHLQLVQTIFRTLVAGNSLASAVRRPTSFDELVKRCGGDAGTVARIIDEFRSEQCNFLQPPLPKTLEPETVVDLTHESLIRQWKQLAEWLMSESRAAEQWAHLSVAAQRHAAGEGDLLQGLDLAASGAWWSAEKPTSEWARRYGGDFAENEAFLLRSQAEANKLVAAKRMRRAAVLALLLTTIGTVSYSWYQSASALEQLSITNASLTQAKLLVETRQAETNRSNVALLGAQANLEAQKATLEANNVALEEARNTREQQNRMLQSSVKATEEARNEVSAQNEHLTRINQKLKIYADIDVLVDEIKRTGFSSNPAINTDSAGIAVRGFDTVAYHRRQLAVEGRRQYHSLWNGAIWLFESEENKQLFDKEPERYVPAFGGFCTPCLYSWHKYQADPRAWHIVDGRLYLATSYDLIADFKKHTQKYIRKAAVNWKSLESRRVSPTAQTTTGAMLKPHILLVDAPDSYWILKDSAADYSNRKEWLSAVTEQQNLISHLMRLPPENRRRAELLPDAYASLGRYYMEGTEFAAALNSFNEGLKLDPDSLPLRLGRAHTLMLTGQDVAAEQAYRADLGKLIPGSNTWEDEVLDDLDALEKRGVVRPAFARVRAWMETDASYTNLVRTTNASFKKKQWGETTAASQGLVTYLLRLPENNERRIKSLAAAYSELCWYQVLNKDAAGGLTNCDKSVSVDPELFTVKVNRAHALLLTGRTEAALEAYREGRGQKAKDKIFETEVTDDLNQLETEGIRHPEFAQVRAIMNGYTKFSKDVDTAIAAADRGQRLEVVDAQKSIVSYLRGLPANDPLRSNLPLYLRYLAGYQLMTKDYSGALRSAEEASQVDPSSDIQSRRALALLMLNRTADAEAVYRTHIGKKTTSGKAWEALALEELNSFEDNGARHPEFPRMRILLGQKS